MKITLDGVREIEPGLWRANLNPSEVTLFGHVVYRTGVRSVIIIDGPASFDRGQRTLTFEHSVAKLLNVGESNEVLALAGNTDRGHSPAVSGTPERLQQPESKLPKYTTGDARFLSELPPTLKSLGEKLLGGVRTHFRGTLQFFEKSGKYVEAPVNFWTVRIQPRDQSLRITLRGRPESFRGIKLIELKDDMAGYSSFKLSTEGQLPDAVAAIRQAADKSKRLGAS